MAADITSDDFVAKSSDVLAAQEAALKTAHEKALAELNRIQIEAAGKGHNLSSFEDYEMYEATGIGRYVIMRDKGWEPLYNIISNDKDQKSIVANIDFSANIYPEFDGVIGEHFESPYLLDPLDDKFMSFKPLRDNLAAVRNFLVENYFANPPHGMTDEKAKACLNQIAAYVGDGLYNNWLFLGVIPNHDPRKPFIDLERASEPDGKGAQYVYDKILEMQRQSSWLRPFDAVKALFGGKKQHDWQLPSSETTGFLEEFRSEQSHEASLKEQEETATQSLAAIEAKMQAVRDARTLTNVATDIDSLGNQLIYTAMHMEGVAQLSEPVRRDAVDIAHEILRKLKLSIGGKQLLDGLKMAPNDDMATLGGIKGVAMVYERLLAWARANNDNAIFQHPSVLAATQAIGQLGYQAKREALRMAELAKNGVVASAITEQLKRLPAAYAQMGNASFGSLLETVENGMNTILARTQQVSVSGAKIGHSVEDSLGTTLSREPTAGSGKQVGMDNAAQRNAQALAADQQAQMAMAQRMHSQLAAQARQQQAQGQQATQAQQPAPRGNSTVGRQSLQAAQSARQQQRQTTAATTNPNNPAMTALTPAQQQLMARQANVAATAEAARRRDEQNRLEQQRLQQVAQQETAARNAQRAAQRAAMRIDPSMLSGMRNATSLNGVAQGTPVVMGGRRIDPTTIRNSINAKPASPQAPQANAVAPTTLTPSASTTAAKPTLSNPDDDKQTSLTPIPPTQQPPTRGGGRSF
jgi:hypothetical protein